MRGIVIIGLIGLALLFSGCTTGQATLAEKNVQTNLDYDYSKAFLTQQEVCETFHCDTIETRKGNGGLIPEINVESEEIAFENKNSSGPSEEKGFMVITQSVKNCVNVECAKQVLAIRKNYFVERQTSPKSLRDGIISYFPQLGDEAYIFQTEGSGHIFWIIAQQDNTMQEFYFSVSYPEKAIPLAKELIQKGLDKQQIR